MREILYVFDDRPRRLNSGEWDRMLTLALRDAPSPRSGVVFARSQGAVDVFREFSSKLEPLPDPYLVNLPTRSLGRLLRRMFGAPRPSRAHRLARGLRIHRRRQKAAKRRAA